jgi:asparagine synthetase A
MSKYIDTWNAWTFIPANDTCPNIIRSRTLRIWESDLFTSVELEAPPRFKTGTWMPDSKTLIFAVEGTARISALQMNERPPSLS